MRLQEAYSYGRRQGGHGENGSKSDRDREREREGGLRRLNNHITRDLTEQELTYHQRNGDKPFMRSLPS